MRWATKAKLFSCSFLVDNVLTSYECFQNGKEAQKKNRNREMIVLEDYRSNNDVDLRVTVGDVLQVNSVPVNGWLWAQRCCDGQKGFVPASVVTHATKL